MAVGDREDQSETTAKVIVFKVKSGSEVSRLSLVGNCPELGDWDISRAIHLECGAASDLEDGGIVWKSTEIVLPLERLPLQYRFVANAHRHKPNSRPLVWDQASRFITYIPEDGSILCEFEPTPDNSDSGWVHHQGAGAFQLRIGQPPGSVEPMITLVPALQQPYRVDLYGATEEDPKKFARLSFSEGLGLLRSPEDNEVDESADNVNNVIFLLNAQSLEALAFRVDITALSTGQLLARCFVTPQTLATLEGSISASLMAPDLQHAGIFRAAFLVVTAFNHPDNNLGNMQRRRWAPGGTLDIGHRGSGASKVKGHSVRENTLLSFQKAALNHSDFIEFDVHQTADGEIVVHHDFEIKLLLASQEIKIPLTLFTYRQLQSEEFTRFMAHASDKDDGGIHKQRDKLQLTLKRTMTSGEDMFRSLFKPSLSTSPEAGSLRPVRFLSDKIASLREAFRRTPHWLGFNIELKYPTEAEVVAMGARFYSRSIFVDAVLKVVLEEAGERKVIFSTFDPDCATLVSLKQPRFPVFFLTCGGTKHFADPRMNSLEAALQFARSSHLQGVVAEAGSIMSRLKDVVAEFHNHGLFLFTWGDVNNDITCYMDQKEAGVDAIILDDIAKMAKATNKQQPTLFPKSSFKSPASVEDLKLMTGAEFAKKLERLSTNVDLMNIIAIGSIESPQQVVSS